MTATLFITGAGRGLGFSLAKMFLSKGFRTFAGIYRITSNLQNLAEQFPRDLINVPLDVTNIASVIEAAQEVSRQADGLDILINNAGFYPDQLIATLEELDLTDEGFFETMDINAFGPLRITQQFLPLLARGQRKLIVNISSEAGSIGDCWREREFAYCMSKAAFNMQSKILQNHLGKRGFKILAVHPGWMCTDMGGPNADIHPDKAAAGIYTLATKEWQPEDPIYMDFEGNLLNW